MTAKLIFYKCPYHKIEKDIAESNPYKKDCFCKTSEGLEFKGVDGGIAGNAPNTPSCVCRIEDIKEYDKSINRLRLEDKFYLWNLKLSLKPNEIILIRGNNKEIDVTSSIR